MKNVGELFPFDRNIGNAVGEANITVGVVDMTSTTITTRIYR